jgi:hypothetical protein
MSLVVVGKYLGLLVSIGFLIWGIMVKKPDKKSAWKMVLFVCHRVVLFLCAVAMLVAFIGCLVDVQEFRRYSYIIYTICGLFVFSSPWIYGERLLGWMKFLGWSVGVLLCCPPGQFLIKLIGL